MLTFARTFSKWRPTHSVSSTSRARIATSTHSVHSLRQRSLQVPAFLQSIPLVRRTLKSVGLGPKPPKIPTKEEFETMDDQKKYMWSLFGTRVPSPWDKSETLSRALLRELIAKNHLEAKYSYATMIVTGSMRGDVPEAIQLWEECSRAGHSWAKSNLAKTLSEGTLVRQDLERAARLYQEAWEAVPVMSEGHAHTAALNLADLYLKASRPKDAVVWMHKAADEAHDILAQYQLGVAYSLGRFGVDIDKIKARQYTQAAADGGLVLAQHNLACLLFEGAGPDSPPDYIAAAHYFSKAHYQEYYWSSLNLAGMFARGQGVPLNFATAFLLLREVHAFGSPEQQKAANDVLLVVQKLEAGEQVEDRPLPSTSSTANSDPSSVLSRP